MNKQEQILDTLSIKIRVEYEVQKAGKVKVLAFHVDWKDGNGYRKRPQDVPQMFYDSLNKLQGWMMDYGRDYCTKKRAELGKQIISINNSITAINKFQDETEE